MNRKMSFESLPEELLIEQLLLLPPEDVINACQSSRQFAQVCRRQDLWIRLVMKNLPHVRLTRESNPRDIYLTGMMITRKFPGLKLSDLEDPIDFYNYSINHADKINGLLEILIDPAVRNQIASMVGRDPESNVIIQTRGGTVPFPNILTEPIVGSVLFNMLRRQYPELYQSVIWIVQYRRALKQSQEDIEEKIRYAVQNGQYYLQYHLPDGSLHGIRLTDRLLPVLGQPQAKNYIENEIIRLERGRQQIVDVEAGPIQEHSPRGMSDAMIEWIAKIGKFYLRYQLPDGSVRTFELPLLYGVFPYHELEQMLSKH